VNTAANIDELLGPEPTIQEQPEETPVEQLAETPIAETSSEPIAPPKQSPEEIVENYKKMAHAERMERKQLQEQMRVMQTRFEQLYGVMQPKEEPAPEYDDDPLGATHTKVEKALQSIEELKQGEVQRQQSEQFHGFVRTVQADEVAFSAKIPDYREAISFVQQRRLTELQAMGYDEQTSMQVLAQDALAVSQRAQQLGQSPAAFIYNMAKQLGYVGKQGGNIETIAAGQQVAKSVAGGANPVSNGSLPHNLAELSDTDFDALFKQMKGS
jgi:hypothetical protein